MPFVCVQPMLTSWSRRAEDLTHEQVLDGFGYFGYTPAEGSDHAAMAREHARIFLDVIKGEGFARPNPRPMFPNSPGCCGSSRTRPGCPSGSGGAPAPARPHLAPELGWR